MVLYTIWVEKMIKKLILAAAPIIDLVLIPFVIFSAIILKAYRRFGSMRLSLNTKILKLIGVFPIRDHYNEPFFNDSHLKKTLGEKRKLPGIDFRHDEQLNFLKGLTYQKDFDMFIEKQKSTNINSRFILDNDSFESGDAEFLFNLVRHLKPNKVIEIGCGASTKLISAALDLNTEKADKRGDHICIEPYQQPWLASFGNIQLLRQKVEDIDIELFSSLDSSDLLFIDSSHIIRPQGDVLHEYLEIVPKLNKGVFVHVHDIFTPHDYLENWVKKSVFFWNEQYLLEALLSNNRSYEIVAALNYLKHEEYDALKKVCPYLETSREPGSFYFKIV